MLEFSWDKRKESANLKKHKVSFVEAKSVFFDDNGRLIPDDSHSTEEDRFILLGLSSKSKILTVVHCYRGEVDMIRIISARKATKAESKNYWEYLK